MDFLTSALYAKDEQGEEKLTGALLTHFDTSNLTARAQVFYASVDQLLTDGRIMPSGFKLEEDGVLLSDTQARTAMSVPMTEYIAYELGNKMNMTPKGLLDIVLFAARFGGRVFVNATEYQADPLNTQPILVPMANFRVSNSSFNIYAPYKREDETFRTVSLVDIETDETIPFMLAVPSGESGNYAGVLSMMEPAVGFENLEDFRVYRVDAPLLPFYTLTGEGFVNYLAYNVASCNIGLKVIDEFLGETGYISDDVKQREQPEVRERKKPKHNVSIECNCKTPRTREVLRCIEEDDMASLKELMKDEEAYLTFVWLKHIFSSSWRFDGRGVEDKTAAACAAIQRECRASLLHYSVELLAQRLYICSLGFAQDPYGPVLKGGGVNGFGLKRFIG